MNRREFLKAVGTLGIAAAVPLDTICNLLEITIVDYRIDNARLGNMLRFHSFDKNTCQVSIIVEGNMMDCITFIDSSGRHWTFDQLMALTN